MKHNMKLIFENWRRFLNEEEKGERPIHIFFDMDGVLVDFAGKLAEKINANLAAARAKQSAEHVHPHSKSNRKNLQKLVHLKVRQVTPEQLEEINFKRDNKAPRTQEEKIIGNYIMSLVSSRDLPEETPTEHPGKDKQLWLDMEKIDGADEMVAAAEQIAGPNNTYVLSSPVGEASIEAKKEWIQKYFKGRFPPERLILTGEKGEWLKNSGIIERKEIAILIDDRSKYIRQFESAGGQTIHHSPPGSVSVSNTVNALRGSWEWKEPKGTPGQELESGYGLVLKVDPPGNVDNIISAGQQKYSSILPEGEQLTKINKFHVTLISGKDYKLLSDGQKQRTVQALEENLPKIILDTSQAFLATREMEGRKTLYLKIQNSPELNSALRGTLGESWPEKYMHLSIANVHGGDPFKSVGDTNEADEGDQKNIVPAVQPPPPKKARPEPPKKARPEIPREMRALGGILRDKMVPVAQVWNNLLNMKDRPQILNQILKGKGLSDEQIQAVLGIL